MTRRFLTVNEFCTEYRTGKTFCYELFKTGDLTAVKRGRSTLICAESAERWAASLPPIRPPSAGAVAAPGPCGKR